MTKAVHEPLSKQRYQELAGMIQRPDVPLALRAANRLKLFLEEEKIVKPEGERISAWRTIPEFPDIYCEGEKDTYFSGHYIHEQGRVCNISSDWEGTLRNGLLVQKETAQKNIANGVGDKDFLQAAIITIDAVIAYADRYEIPALSDGIRYGAKHFQDALQVMRMLHFALWASNVYHNTVGRFDQYMYPYLKNDLEDGILTKEEALVLLEEFFLSFNRDSTLYTGMQQGDNGQSMMLGGCDSQGNCAVNELTYMCLEASLHNGKIDPKINLRVDKNTPLELYEKGTELTKQGLGFPQYSNDDIVIPALVEYGYSLEDARNYTVAACWEFIVPGVGMDVPNIGAICIANVADYCIRNYLSQCVSFDELMDCFRKEMRTETEKLAASLNNLWIEPAPYQSVLMSGCVEKGQDISLGAKYNNFGFHGTGIADAVDQLCAVDMLVYQNKSLSAADFLKKLEEGFENDRELLQWLRDKAPRMGRDQVANPMAEEVLNAFADALAGLKNERGGIIRPGTGSAMYYVWHAREAKMLADGHLPTENFGANFSPSLLLTNAGPLSVIKAFSCDALNRVCNGGPLTLELHDTVFRNADGIQKVAQMVRTFVQLGGHQLQLNAISRETLLDARVHPEDHPNLVVRVWGWSGHFTQLDTMYQDQIIERTSYQSI